MSALPANPRLSNYRLDRLLGSGGMGSVYLAEDLVLGRQVAIKFLSAERAADESSRRRLIREARAAAALDHPNICGVHEVILEPDGRACIVMQFVEGETLASALASGPLEIDRARSIVRDVASALSAAHGRGILHRDIKPENIIIGTDGRAKLLDFGLASLSEVAAPADSSTQTNLTMPGVIVGTPAYLSPEQVQQLPLDGRSDLFALGAVLFECLTGRRAFPAHTMIDAMNQVLLEDPPPPSTLRQGLLPWHDDLCQRLLAKDPADRVPSADDLLALLQTRLDGPPPAPRAPGPGLRRTIDGGTPHGRPPAGNDQESPTLPRRDSPGDLPIERLLPAAVAFLALAVVVTASGVTPVGLWNSMETSTRITALLFPLSATVFCAARRISDARRRLIVVTLAFASFVAPLLAIRDIRAGIQATGSTGTAATALGLGQLLGGLPLVLVAALSLATVTLPVRSPRLHRLILSLLAAFVLGNALVDGWALRQLTEAVARGTELQGLPAWMVQIIQP